VKANDTRRLTFFEVAADGIADLGAEVFPSIRLGDDGLSESTRDETAFGFIFMDFKDDLVHGFKVSRAGADMEVWFASFSGGSVVEPEGNEAALLVQRGTPERPKVKGGRLKNDNPEFGWHHRLVLRAVAQENVVGKGIGHD
jgi:hypothetical protein